MFSINLRLGILGLLASTAVETAHCQAETRSLTLPGAPVEAAPSSIRASTLPGREEDARVEQIAFRLAVAGRMRCTTLKPNIGLVLQHLSQFEQVDRPGMIAKQSLDRGAGVIVVVPDSPAAAAGIRPGDVLLAIDGHALPPETALSAAFDAARAHARADAIRDLLADAGTQSFTISLLRDDMVSAVKVTPVSACPSDGHLARSNQQNAYADGRHVFLTTGLLSRLQNDDELAFIIAHEMAHNILHHATIMRVADVKHGLGHTLGRSGRIVRETEREADALGGDLMIDAGFDPVRGAAILKRLDRADLGIDLFAAHDSAGKRIAAMRVLENSRIPR
ncbi:conserved hypothetical protein [Sphingomonas aurantiaca]|uniref:PDZ domain-containing protein n=1 Tax=Sphingomonas aurantiaca TaxID=185949 RepID=A0A5E7XP56_9SPHN|nr:conserved hypothetical protein [Sphingomonas aurantiaca]